jgi:hypothetical protein
MGRIVDLFSEVASEADVSSEGMALPTEVYERLRQEWEDDDIEDALTLVHDKLLEGELVECADSLSARLLEVLSEYGSSRGWSRAQEGGAVLSLDVIGQLARRVARLEEVLESYRDEPPPDRRAFDALRQRLMNLGIEKEMAADEDEPALLAGDDDEDEEE